MKELFNKSTTLAECDNFLLLESVKRIWKLHESGVICYYKVIFCSNGGGFAPTAEDRIKTISEEHPFVSFDFYGPSEVISAMQLEGESQKMGDFGLEKKKFLSTQMAM